MEQLKTLLAAEWQQFLAYAPRLVLAVLVIAISYLLGKYAARALSTVFRRASLRKAHESFFRIITVVITLFVGLIIALNILGLEKLAISVLAGGSVMAIVLGFAFREIGENFLAGLFLAFSRPFRTGDAIKTEDIEGRVQNIELRYTHLRTDDGRDVYVPSSQMFNKPVTNFTKDGLRRISFTVGLDYADDSKAACALLQETVEDIDGVLKDPAPGVFILALAPQYVEIQVFIWMNVFDNSVDVLAVRTEVLDQCRQALLAGGFTVSSETATNIVVSNKAGDV